MAEEQSEYQLHDEAARTETQDRVHLVVSAAARFNLSAFQNAVPLLHELSIRNLTHNSLHELELSLSAEPAFVQSRSWRLATVAAQQTYALNDLDVRVDGALVSRLTEATPATLLLELRSSAQPDLPLARHEVVIELLARNEWAGIGCVPQMIAAFVQPNDPAIDRILKSASRVLQRADRSGSIDGYAHGSKRAWELASAIWTAVLQRQLSYALPPASFELAGQKVRSPSQVLDAGLATCLDLTLLFAACLEQAALNPVVVFTRGHAFVGLWLRNEQFSSAVVDDITALRKRLKLDELVFFETTLAVQGEPVGFAQAIAHANRQLSEEEADNFELAVDIRRARMSRIKPLTCVEAVPQDAPVAYMPAPLIELEEAPELSDTSARETELAELDPKDRLARWQRKLLDLSLRNSLLNFKPGKRSVVLDVSAPDLEDALAAGKTIKLLSDPELMEGRDPRSQALHEARTLEHLRKAHASDALLRGEVFTRLSRQELELRLVELFRGARVSLQEGGSNTLFLSLGFLAWTRDARADTRLRAPLILVPVTLNRKSARSGFTLQAHEDEARFNPTLVEMLRQDFQLELGVPLGELPTDTSGVDVAGVWKRVSAAIKDIQGWEVSEDVVLSMFSFAKYLMWKDLVERTDDLRRSPVVAHLLDTPREPYRSDIEFPALQTLDRDYAPAKMFSPLPADSSQLSAVLAAASGKDFVLIGPPGTGKSQTIANLIAQCLAEGKRVLFVAEKIAALDVVHRRLREVGLSPFCLELHSNKSRKLEVLAQLQSAWEASDTADATSWTTKAQQLSRLREQLSAYVQRLHHTHDNGWTVYQAIGTVVAGQTLPELQLRWPSPRSHDRHAYTALCDLAGRLQANATAVGQQDLATGPLAQVHATEWSARWQQDIVQAAHTLHSASLGFSTTVHAFGNQLGLSWPSPGHRARSALDVLAKALPLAATNNWGFCAAADSSSLCAALKSATELLLHHRELSAQQIDPWPAELHATLNEAILLLEQRRRLQQELGVPWPVAARAEIERGLQHLNDVASLRKSLSVRYGNGVEQLNVAQLQREWEKADKAIWPLSGLARRRIRKILEAVVEGTGEPRIAEDLAALVRIRQLEAELDQIDPGAAGEQIWSGARTRIISARAALAANAALTAARAQRPFSCTGMEAALEGWCGERWSDEVRRLQQLDALDRQLLNHTGLEQPSLGLWRGRETDIELLRAAMEFERERQHLLHSGISQARHAAVADGRCGALLLARHTLLAQRATLETQLLGQTELRTRCPQVWRDLDTDTEAVARALRFHGMLQASLGGLGSFAGATREALHALLANRVHELAEDGAVRQLCVQLPTQLTALNAAVAAFSTLAMHTESQRTELREHSAELLSDIASAAHQAAPGLRAWCGWRKVQQDATDAGLQALAQAVETQQLSAAQAPKAFEVNYARWWLGEAVDDDPVLKHFVSAEHEQRIRDFRALDDEFTRITRQLIRARLCADLPSPEALPRNSEWGVLRHELSKKRAHKPLRQLLQEIPSVVLKLTPCLLMSPLSIAQYLSADASNFDIVVFDEASQIPVWDAIGAMARARQVVMVGDPKQLPPTSFFDRACSAEPDSAEVESDQESILDECIGAGLPTRDLCWHYRSRHESLIAFSNHHYYNSRLVTFPSPVTDDRAVSLHCVAGCYEKGGARINPPEAKALVADLVARLRSPGFRQSALTIGVVTFNAEQQRLIEDLLDAERRNDPELEHFFSEGLLEPVFVKNLESVQGDERDIMYFSVTYGPDASGLLSMNFGPLNRSGGERRLNVAITRARHQLRIFASLRGDQMDLSRSSAIGVRDLKQFLEFAERGTPALAQAQPGSDHDFDSPFEASVAASLRGRNWRVQTQIGASRFRVDLGVVHPDLPGCYLAGVECDGATYHRSATARDRDKLREQILRTLGWEIVRIWSTDWWINPAGTLDRLHARLEALLQQDRQQRALAQAAQEQADRERMDAAAMSAADFAPNRAEDQTAIATDTTPAEGLSGAHPQEQVEAFYPSRAASAFTPQASGGTAASSASVRPLYTEANPAAAVAAGAISAERFFDAAYNDVLIAMIDHTVHQEGPVLATTLARRIARAHGFLRTGSRIQERVEQLARHTHRTTEEPTGSFYWPAGTESGSEVHFRWPADVDSARGVEEICEQELRSLAAWVLADGRHGEDAMIAMAREIGLGRLAGPSRARLQWILASLQR